MTTKEINNIIAKLYDEVQRTGWSSHLYRDDDWHNLYQIRDICNRVVPNGYKTLRQEIYGYMYENMCKAYLFTIEHEETGERIIDISVKAHAAGSVQNVWSAYDTTAIFWRHED